MYQDIMATKSLRQPTDTSCSAQGEGIGTLQQKWD